jgi:hypothetical protein
MQFSNMLSIAAIFAFAATTPAPKASVTAKAASASPLALFQRQAVDAGVELCVNAQFQGYCVHIIQPLYQCVKFLSITIPSRYINYWQLMVYAVELSSDLNDQVSAVGPDADAYDCRFYL